MKMYYILDLERSLPTGRMFFWKGNKYGYTTQIKEAGIFPAEKAKEIAAADKDQRTVLIPVHAAIQILNLDK